MSVNLTPSNSSINCLVSKPNILTIDEFVKELKISINNPFLNILWNGYHNNTWIELTNDLIRWMGYEGTSRKAKQLITDKLKNNFISEIDYKITDLPKNTNPILSSQIPYIYFLTYKCLKKLYMTLKTSRGDEIREYFIQNEEELFANYLIYQTKHQSIIIQRNSERLEKLESQIQSPLDKQSQEIISCTNSTIRFVELKQLYTKNVVYAAYIGKYNIDNGNRHFFKFGRSSDFESRQKTHSNDFETFDLIYIKECLNNNRIENSIKQCLRKMRIKPSILKIGEKNHTETFYLPDDMDLNDVLEEFDIIISNDYAYQSKNDYQLKILSLESQLEKIKIQSELDKTQLQSRIRELELLAELRDLKYENELSKLQTDSVSHDKKRPKINNTS